jgi:hypothetical protein
MRNVNYVVKRLMIVLSVMFGTDVLNAIKISSLEKMVIVGLNMMIVKLMNGMKMKKHLFVTHVMKAYSSIYLRLFLINSPQTLDVLNVQTLHGELSIVLNVRMMMKKRECLNHLIVFNVKVDMYLLLLGTDVFLN